MNIVRDGNDYEPQQISKYRLRELLQHERDNAQLRERLAQLEDWQATVTAALGREGGAFFEDVPEHVRAMRRRITMLEEALNPQDVSDINSILDAAEPGKD